MIKDHIEEVRNDLKSKRDALLIGHQNLKKDSDDWNKGIILISLFGGLMESIKMRLKLDGAGFALLPIIFSAIIFPQILRSGGEGGRGLLEI